MSLRYDARVRRGALLAKATLSPAGLVTGGVLAVLGIGLGIGLPWVIGAGFAAWATSALLHLRDPKLVGSLLAPQFDRDLGSLDREHRSVMVAGLDARDRFESAIESLPDSDEFTGMQVRVNQALERLYDSLSWSQRAAGFLRRVDAAGLERRLATIDSQSPVAQELTAQLEEVTDVRRRRDETMHRAAATVTGIETLAVKMGSLALDSAAPGAQMDEVGVLRRELDAYLAGLEEIEAELGNLPPQPA